MLRSSSIVHVYRQVLEIKVVQFCKYSPNSRCRPWSCLLTVLAVFLANSSPFLLREMSETFRHFISLPKQFKRSESIIFTFSRQSN